MRAATFLTMALTPFMLSAWGQNTTQDKQVKKQEKAQAMSCRSPFHAAHADVRHTESKGVGYDKGYTTLEWFGIYDYNPNFMPFLDLRGHVFNDGQLAGNVGIGERTVIPSINHIFGLYLYYDVRQEEHDLTVNQLSPGIELLGKRMEYRINAYFPVGNDESDSYYHKFKKFEGNRILVKSRKKYAMTGADGEIGAHLNQSTRHDFYFGIGPYYFTADPDNAWGGKTRLYWRYKDYISLEASYSYDHIFKNVVQGTVAFSYPFGKKLKRQGRNCPNINDLALSRAAFAPYRFEIPVVETHHRTNVAMNPATGQPWNVWFVNNTSHSAGTYESPFPTLAQAQNASGPNDIIYVFPGDGTTNGMNAGITLQNGQKLFGSGTVQTLKTSVGHIHIPALSTTPPTITNGNGSAIFLANANEVSGMNVQAIAGSGIDGSVNSIVGAHIHNNMIFAGIGRAGISIFGSDTINVLNNYLFSSDVTSSGIPGIFVSAVEGSVIQANLNNNTINGYFQGIEFSIHGQAFGATATTGSLTVAGNTISGFGRRGIIVFNGIPNGTLRIMNNMIADTRSSGPGTAGISVSQVANQNSGNFFIQGNTIVSTTSQANNTCISLAVTATPITTTSTFSVKNNTVAVGPGNNSSGITIVPGGNAVYCVSLANNTVTTQGGNARGMDIGTASPAVINIDEFSNNIAPNILMSGTVNMVAPGTCGR